MTKADNIRKNTRSTKIIIITITLSITVTIACFIVVSLLPAPKGPLFKDPLRSLITGIGVLGVAYPLCTAGYILKKRSASSPYYEGGFIATVFYVFGFACLLTALACIAFGLYALLNQFFNSAG